VASPSFDDLLGELRAEYLRDAPARLEAMRHALDALAASPADASALSLLRLGFHAFAGNGRTYGFPQITRFGLEGDVQCASCQRAGPPEVAVLEGWRVLAEAIGRELRAGPSPTRLEAPRGRPPEPRAARILSVDDDPHQGAFLRAVLCAAGYEVRICSDPARFFDEQRAFGPDVVLMDVVLPGTNGYEIARVLHAQAPALPIVFLTTAGEAEEASRAGAAELLRKPVVPSTLVAALERQLAGPLEQGGATAHPLEPPPSRRK
jgi:CheY-like chemotaxis protein